MTPYYVANLLIFEPFLQQCSAHFQTVGLNLKGPTNSCSFLRSSISACVRLKPALLGIITHQFFLKFGTVILVLEKTVKSRIWWEFLFARRMDRMGQKWCFLHFLKNCVISFSGKLKIKNHIAICISPQTTYLVKLYSSQVKDQNAVGQSDCSIL